MFSSQSNMYVHVLFCALLLGRYQQIPYNDSSSQYTTTNTKLLVSQRAFVSFLFCPLVY